MRGSAMTLGRMLNELPIVHSNDAGARAKITVAAALITNLARLLHGVPIVRVFDDNAKRFGCPRLAISGHTAGSSRTSALPPKADIGDPTLVATPTC